jgi:hypothetical protein
MYPAITMTEGHSRVKPDVDFKAEVAMTSETIATARYSHFIRMRAEAIKSAGWPILSLLRFLGVYSELQPSWQGGSQTMIN